MYTVHFWAEADSGEVYDDTQTGYFTDRPMLEGDSWTPGTDEAIEVRDGDILIVASEGTYGVMVGAWPVAVASDTQEHHFHRLAPMASWATLDDGKYLAAAEEALRLWEER